MKKFISCILLSGGKGQRFGSVTPKQYHLINNKPIAKYSFDIFNSMEEIDEIIVVCEKEYKNIFIAKKNIIFTSPGKKRQDSVFNALQKISPKSDFVCIHDAARPFIDVESVKKVLNDATVHEAAVIGYKAINTMKKCDLEGYVIKTINRSAIWEVQTPQIIKTDLLKKGFDYIKKNNIQVTDDVSIIEAIGKKVKITQGPKKNIKITTIDDLNYAKNIL